MPTFEEEYKRLNIRQREAVEAIDGPVLVIAGPGTGKTQLLSMRVANILRKTDVDPGNILCLTFTNKAASNMRDRLYKLAGADSRGVVVRTFHSFAGEIMNTYPDYFWSGARLSVAPDALQLEIIQGILASLPLDNPLASTFAGAFTQLSAVQEALKLAKEAGLTPGELRRIIKENIRYIDKIEPLLTDILTPSLSYKNLAGLQKDINGLPQQELEAGSLLLPLSTAIKESLDFAVDEDKDSGKTTNTRKWKAGWVQTINGKKGMYKERSRNEWWLSLADVYESYREQMHQQNYYDYSDMMIEVITQTEKNPDMRADLQEQFQYVLIDEFQDTNAAQLRLSHLIADHYAANNKPNLMAVGDDDQSIFAFNGAELNNMLGFRRSYPDTKLIVLEDNYRSAQDVLDTARSVIELAEDRLSKRETEITKNLAAKNPPEGKTKIEHLRYPTRQHQQIAIAKRVKEIWQTEDGTVAVLARRHESLKQLAGILRKEKVPIVYERQSNVLEHEAVKLVYTIARAAAAISEGDKNAVNLHISHLLRAPMWEISPKTLWRLAVDNYSSPDWLASLLDSEDSRLSDIGHWLVWLSRHSHNLPVTISLEYILGLKEGQKLQSPFRAYYLNLRPVTSTYLETLSAVELLRGLANEFAGVKDAHLADFVKFIELNLNTDRVITDESWFMSDQKAVHLLTVHKAKGLEFDNVFVIDMTEDMWRPKAGRRKSPANLRLQSYFDKYDDFVRLLYVAATRAKSTLIATSYYTDSKGEEILATPLLSALPASIIDAPETEDIEVLEDDLMWPVLENSDEKSVLVPRFENFYLSPSSLIDFLDVAESGPQNFKQRHLLRLPTERSPQGSYGTAIHAALETAQRLINTSELKLEPVIDRFEQALIEQHMLPLEFEQYLAKGEALLTKLFKENLLDLPKGSSSEQRLRDVFIEEARLGGNLDSIYELAKNELIITDYKTGKPLSSFETKDKTKTVKAWRHRTQLVFYSLLARNTARYKGVGKITGRMVYLEAEKQSRINLIYEPTEEDLARIAKLSVAAWKHITGLNFPATDNYSKDIDGIRQFEDDLIEGRV
ncbi:MAG TPA: ATP-dependent DNA helicase [Candidatus Saccharimonadales bacterium]|nr:ATP-dependent DNA helicase [Candidatus Saccharimonadales bacterium]